MYVNDFQKVAEAGRGEIPPTRKPTAFVLTLETMLTFF